MIAAKVRCGLKRCRRSRQTSLAQDHHLTPFRTPRWKGLFQHAPHSAAKNGVPPFIILLIKGAGIYCCYGLRRAGPIRGCLGSARAMGCRRCGLQYVVERCHYTAGARRSRMIALAGFGARVALGLFGTHMRFGGVALCWRTRQSSSPANE